jgi:hypothetical protein
LLGLLAGRTGMLRLIMALPDPQARPVRVLGAGRLRVPPRSCLRHAADQHRHRQARRPAPGPGGRHPGGLAARAPRRRGDLPGPGRSLRRRRPHRRAGRDPGGRPVAMRREAPGCIPGSAGRNSEGGSWVRWLTWI